MGDNLGFEKAKIQGGTQIAQATQNTTNQIGNYVGNVYIVMIQNLGWIVQGACTC